MTMPSSQRQGRMVVRDSEWARSAHPESQTKKKLEDQARQETLHQIEQLLSQATALAQSIGYTCVTKVTPHTNGQLRKKLRYVNPDNPNETWNGRGRKPAWALEKLEQGADLEQFRAGPDSVS